jgi:hypothetical protein
MNDLPIVTLQDEQDNSIVLPKACLDNILISPECLIIIVFWTKRRESAVLLMNKLALKSICFHVDGGGETSICRIILILTHRTRTDVTVLCTYRTEIWWHCKL